MYCRTWKQGAYLAVPTSACSVHQHHDQNFISSVLYTAVQTLKTAMKAYVNSKSANSVNIPWRGTSACRFLGGFRSVLYLRCRDQPAVDIL